MSAPDDVFGPVIHSYSRAQALADGVLVDVSGLAHEAGFVHPVAITAAVFAILAPWASSTEGDVSRPGPGQPLYGSGQDFTGRLWDLLMVFKLAIRRVKGSCDRVEFAPLFLRESDRCTAPDMRPDPPVLRPVPMYSLCGPGDDAAPVITILLEGED